MSSVNGLLLRKGLGLFFSHGFILASLLATIASTSWTAKLRWEVAGRCDRSVLAPSAGSSQMSFLGADDLGAWVFFDLTLGSPSITSPPPYCCLVWPFIRSGLNIIWWRANHLVPVVYGTTRSLVVLLDRVDRLYRRCRG